MLHLSNLCERANMGTEILPPNGKTNLFQKPSKYICAANLPSRKMKA